MHASVTCTRVTASPSDSRRKTGLRAGASRHVENNFFVLLFLKIVLFFTDINRYKCRNFMRMSCITATDWAIIMVGKASPLQKRLG